MRASRASTSILPLLSVCLAGCSNGNGHPESGNPDTGQGELLTCQDTGPVAAGRIGPEHIAYRGAFRLPNLAAAAPGSFAWGGQAMSVNTEGDPDGKDEYRGSLFVAGNDAEDAYSDVRACWVAELAIPEPVVTRDVAALPVASLLQDLTDLRGDALYGPEIYFELPKHGIQVVREQGVDYLAMVFGQHIEDEYAPDSCTGDSDPACVAPLAARPLGPLGQLDTSATLGPWWITGASLYSLNDYLFRIPQAFADLHLGGRRLAAGRFRDGGQGSQGPVAVAVDPWLDGAEAPAANTRLPGLALLLYASVTGEGSRLEGYQHPDEWAGAAWIDTPERDTLVFAGAKAVGRQSWYGWQRCPGGEVPCVEPEAVGGPGCFEAGGGTCDLGERHYCDCDDQGCDPDCYGDRGWWTQGWEGQLLFYDPADLARVAAGEIAPDQPQPYACLGIADRLFLSTPASAVEGYGIPPMRRYLIGAAAYDPDRGFLYLTELLADPESEGPIVHVWAIEA